MNTKWKSNVALLVCKMRILSAAQELSLVLGHRVKSKQNDPGAPEKARKLQSEKRKLFGDTQSTTISNVSPFQQVRTKTYCCKHSKLCLLTSFRRKKRQIKLSSRTFLARIFVSCKSVDCPMSMTCREVSEHSVVHFAELFFFSSLPTKRTEKHNRSCLWTRYVVFVNQI